MNEKTKITLHDFKSLRFSAWAFSLVLVTGIALSLVIRLIELYFYPDIPGWVIGGVAGLVIVPILSIGLPRIKRSE